MQTPGGADRSGGAGMPATMSSRRCEMASASAPSRGPRRSSAPSSPSSCSAYAPRIWASAFASFHPKTLPTPLL